MAIMDPNIELDLIHLYALVADLGDQLSHNRVLANSLQNESIKLKAQALHAETGFVLRRFNLHLTKEEYDSELERMNNALASENQTLQYDNKQLNSLLKEYEQTLDSVMSSFRKRAHDVQLQELETIKHYESILISSETEILNAQLASDTSLSLLIAKCSRLLRMVLRLTGGEEPTPPSPPASPPLSSISDASNIFETRCSPDLVSSTPQDWSLDREAELSRLEKENEELRMLLQASETASSCPTVPLSFPKIAPLPRRGLPPRRTRLGHSSFSSESSHGDQRTIQFFGGRDHSEIHDMPDDGL
ncbi:hypothetical protein PNOK_0707500 [Pyrrhoderma noxium]|uniref:Uncharacterized protein n=1 Tax=Pyrrhoderma noxium TaxID=2282107 RepID=A0A286UBP0_9AGAM|nr:hypothetical protein PNOK_0707500 [Pyrrhoderma noxium]